jgi:hypothetical protein
MTGWCPSRKIGGRVRRSGISAALAFFLAAALGCYPAAGPVPPPATAADAEAAKTRFPDATAELLSLGRDLFSSHCNACHQYPDIWRVEDRRWPEIVESMGKKAKLDDAQAHAVLLFILVARSQGARASTTVLQTN